MAVTGEIIDGKWKPAIIFCLSGELRRPSELQRSIPQASRRVLNAWGLQ
ncbi:winged helix-turn-helix transcriptional regulator [Siphonobacter sp. BAB-5405]